MHDLQHERGFADARLSADENGRTADNTAAQHPVNFRDTGDGTFAVRERNILDGQRLAVKPHLRAAVGTAINDQFLGKTIPPIAGGTLSQPLGRHVTAMLTKESCLALFQILFLLG